VALVDAITHVLSPAMQAVVDRAMLVAPTDANILILGEDGVGRKVLARCIHRLSRRAGKPMVWAQPGALSHALVESELFGLVARALGPTSNPKAGVFEAAHGATVGLDEIGHADAAIVSMILHTIGTRTVHRLGALKPTPTDVRVIATSEFYPAGNNSELAANVEKCRSYFDVTLEVPPLRERRSEIPQLARVFAAAQANGRQAPLIQDAAMTLLERYSWPSNILSLRLAVEQAVILSEGKEIGPDHLPEMVTRGLG
jgi:two-component system response regulator HydG